MRKALVLGGTGFIGKALLEAFCEHSLSAEALGSKALDLSAPGADSKLAALLDAETLLVFGSRAPSALAPWDRFHADIEMASAVARALEAKKPALVCYLSSTAVYGNAGSDLRVDEDTRVLPDSLYGIAKLCGERLLAHAGAPLLILRPGMVYGPHDPSTAYGPARFIRRAREKAAVELFGDGSELRDNLFVGDLARATAALCARKKTGVFVAGSGEAVSFARLAALLKAKTVSLPRKTPKTDQVLVVDKLKEAVPGFPFTPLEEGLRRANLEVA